MGGKALKSFGVERMAPKKYELIKKSIFSFHEEYVHRCNNRNESHISMPASWAKNDYGDVDVVVLTKDRAKFLSFMVERMASKGSATNGNCTSIEFQGAQIDFIFTSDIDKFLWTLNWYSWGDMSAIIGRIIRPYNLKFGNDGLYYALPSKQYKKSVHDKLITNNFITALNLIGFSNTQRAFKSKEEMFDYISTSELMPPNLKELKHQRNARENQTLFDEYISTKNINVNTQALFEAQNDILKYMLKRRINKKIDVEMYDNIKSLINQRARILFVEKFILSWYNPIRRKFRKMRYKLLHGDFNVEKQ